MMSQSRSRRALGRVHPFFSWTTGSAAAVGLLAGVCVATPAQAQDVAPCVENCASLTVGDASAPRGGTATVAVSFAQAPTSDGQAGGPDAIAAVAFTLNAPGDGSNRLALDGCGPGSDPTLPAALQPSASLAGFRLVLENYRCDGGRTSCVCPDGGSGITPDDHLNIAIFGPDPLPEPGSGPVVIPALPSAELFRVRFRVGQAAAAGTTIPLHVVNNVDDASPGSGRAFLSLGDTEAVDQTCVPQPGTPPCTAVNARSQVVAVHGGVEVAAGGGCVGDCNGDSAVTVDEIITMVNIALGNQAVSNCLAGDGNNDGAITVDEIVTAVTNALNGCPS